MPTNVFNSLDSKSIFPIVYFLMDIKKSLFKIYKPWIKPTSYMVKHNITNFDLKQKKHLKIGQKHKFKTVYLMPLMRERTTEPVKH